MNVELTQDMATTEMRFVETVKTRSAKLSGTKRLSSKAGSHLVSI
jgi:hypothetical protein